MNGEFTEAEALFGESRKRGFSAMDRMRVRFVALDEERHAPMRLRGTVSVVRAGYAFIATDIYPDFFCPGSKFGDLVIERGLRLEFTTAFTARGSQAIDLAAASE